MLTSPQAISSKAKQDWQTPAWLFEHLDSIYRFKLDAAADARNAKCAAYYDEKSDGLARPWESVTFCNPPWGNIGPWTAKAAVEAFCGVGSVLLLPQLGLTTSWYRFARRACRTEILSPRIAYVGPGSAPSGGSMLLVFGFGGHGSIIYSDVSAHTPKGRQRSLVVT